MATSDRTGQIASTIGMPSASGQYETARFAAGCFWGVEAAFRKVEGVIATRVGYTGGTAINPTYKDVCTGGTGHAETVEVTFDPQCVLYEELLEVFWSCHDPTTPNRQGHDVGNQYRSEIFAAGERQMEAAEASRRQMQRSGQFSRDIVTSISMAGPFYEAERYHQQYADKHAGSCQTI